jgi:hypothetical protein
MGQKRFSSSVQTLSCSDLKICLVTKACDGVEKALTRSARFLREDQRSSERSLFDVVLAVEK